MNFQLRIVDSSLAVVGWDVKEEIELLYLNKNEVSLQKENDLNHKYAVKVANEMKKLGLKS